MNHPHSAHLSVILITREEEYEAILLTTVTSGESVVLHVRLIVLICCFMFTALTGLKPLFLRASGISLGTVIIKKRTNDYCGLNGNRTRNVLDYLLMFGFLLSSCQVMQKELNLIQ